MPEALKTLDSGREPLKKADSSQPVTVLVKRAQRILSVAIVLDRATEMPPLKEESHMLPILICRHYEVEWLDARTCYCHQCGKQGHWTEEGFSIWIRAQPPGNTPRTTHQRLTDPREQRVA